ncbi:MULTISPECIES: DUF2577 family protein [Bacillus]|uniref:DUF2577 family protein n=1 Tax=Bacillus TaxID=1386 RepID=UPI0006A5B044|nr:MULTISPECIES: DUF2577 family protein [Bacillus]SLC58303.1 Protein of uncharacterised function (DUF2577) [Mycobacteroides abscessus subsp. massiliense]KOC80062.1 phage portal protein [Bacillus velezensis]KSW04658.1 phage portal protein [Bacillus velezensis]MBT9287606.1 DUF2577 domain-containing protein [Bacillus velezensis]MCX2824192.1 DUF2577 family protein [Bacillus sp. H1F1]
MRLSEAIKHLAIGAVGSESPVDMLPAEVVSVSPVEIKLNENEKLIIPSDLIIIPKRLRAGGEDELKNGENVMVVSLKGGQSFFILDKI